MYPLISQTIKNHTNLSRPDFMQSLFISLTQNNTEFLESRNIRNKDNTRLGRITPPEMIEFFHCFLITRAAHDAIERIGGNNYQFPLLKSLSYFSRKNHSRDIRILFSQNLFSPLSKPCQYNCHPVLSASR